MPDLELKTWRVTSISYGSQVETRLVKAPTQEAAEGDLFDSGELEHEYFDAESSQYETEEVVTLLMDHDLANRFIDDPENVFLSEVTAITDEAAGILSKYPGDLELDGLTELSDAAAESLSKHKGGDLYINGVGKLSDAAAKSLSKYQGRIDGITLLMDHDLANRFIDDPENVFLSEVRAITDEAAGILSKYPGDLELDGLTELSDAAAESLSKHKGGDLYIDGVEKLSDAAAKSLSKYQGQIFGVVF